MKNYKECKTVYLGSSDTASLNMYASSESEPIPLNFGENGSYCAYMADEDTEIDENYEKVASFKDKLGIYDDYGFSFSLKAAEINVYRAGDFGCIIQATNGTSGNL